jgi:hypothetical protein
MVVPVAVVTVWRVVNPEPRVVAAVPVVWNFAERLIKPLARSRASGIRLVKARAKFLVENSKNLWSFASACCACEY